MAKITPEFLQKLISYTDETMKWCSRESEQATQKVHDILNIIMTNADRVSALTEESKDAIENMKLMITSLGKDRKKANRIAKALKDTSEQDDEIEKLFSPIIETLQFQDRISQNMGNIRKMTRAWLEVRSTLKGVDKLPQEKIAEMGHKFLEISCMKEERDIIHKRIEGLTRDEEDTSSTVFFF